ncbi:MAG: hypothetical protein K0R53_386 [Burkholderiales bacterium]|nr:hypothetical protein [Burkholderiales bacterium]
MASHDSTQAFSSEHIRDSASGSMRDGGDIYTRVHDLTLLALRSRRFDRREIREVIRAITDGITLGAEQSRADMRRSLADAFRGIDEALRKSTEAGQTALRQLAATGRGFSERELKHALADLKKLEEDFLSTVEQVAEGANEHVRPELRDVLTRARRGGTQTGRQIAGMMAEFAQRFSTASLDVALGGLEAASELSARFAQAAGGALAAIADAISDQRSSRVDPVATTRKPAEPASGST